MYIGSPFPTCLCFRVFGDVVSGFYFLAAVEAEVGLFVPEGGAVGVGWDVGVVSGETLFGGFLGGDWGC